MAVTTVNVDGLLETNEVEDVTHNTQDRKQPAEKSATNKFKPTCTRTLRYKTWDNIAANKDIMRQISSIRNKVER